MPSTFSVAHALVTGAAQGIGAAIARRLAEEGLSVALLDIDEAGAQKTASDIAEATGARTLALGCDVADRQQVRATVARAAEELGGLDTVITNAGITRDAFLHKMTDEQWDAVLAVHLTGTYATVQAAAGHLRGEGPGRVVCISSVSGLTGNLGQANYAAAKAGIVGFAKTAAREFARHRTTVNAVAPGFVDTAMTRAMPEAARNQLLAAVPLGRAATVEEVAGAVAFLCSDDAGYTTGAVIDVNGGFLM